MAQQDAQPRSAVRNLSPAELIESIKRASEAALLIVDGLHGLASASWWIPELIDAENEWDVLGEHISNVKAGSKFLLSAEASPAFEAFSKAAISLGLPRLKTGTVDQISVLGVVVNIARGMQFAAFEAFQEADLKRAWQRGQRVWAKIETDELHALEDRIELESLKAIVRTEDQPRPVTVPDSNKSDDCDAPVKSKYHRPEKAYRKALKKDPDLEPGEFCTEWNGKHANKADHIEPHKFRGHLSRQNSRRAPRAQKKS